ncbi:hypothetical protein EB796_023963 [Bugula neritina]|uniref:Uncharacterized protein n=1 Tax=Bugula neritina TaxID=10212 RepID=A0A7J7IV09_BUGNE|nr:hypothetical protein EB796_023963 [Bugula neritina]
MMEELELDVILLPQLILGDASNISSSSSSESGYSPTWRHLYITTDSTNINMIPTAPKMATTEKDNEWLFRQK